MSLCGVSEYFESFGINRSHAAIYNWAHKADLQPVSTVSADQLAAEEKMIHLHGQNFWLYGAVDQYTNKILHLCLYPTSDTSSNPAVGYILSDS
jgi:transposase-like protein